MTRIVSVFWVVATIATLVLLSGCESAVKTDYVKDLAGDYTTSIEAREVVNPLFGKAAELAGVLPAPLQSLAPTLAAQPTAMATSLIDLTITDGEGTNSGTFKLVMTNAAVLSDAIRMLLPEGVPIPSVVFTLMGNLTADKSMVTISDVVITSEPLDNLARPAVAAILTAGDTEFGYTLAGDTLTLTNPTMAILLQYMDQSKKDIVLTRKADS